MDDAVRQKLMVLIETGSMETYNAASAGRRIHFQLSTPDPYH
jgi:hypothetical protein